jgi:hypothetical protein
MLVGLLCIGTGEVLEQRGGWADSGLREPETCAVSVATLGVRGRMQ